MYAYLNATQIAFTNDIELNNMQQELEAQYQKIINGMVTPAQPVNFRDIINVDTFDNVQSLRNLARLQFDKDSLNVSKVIQVFTPPKSVTLLSYAYYETTDNAQQILDLNNAVDAAFMKGNINILTGNVG